MNTYLSKKIRVLSFVAIIGVAFCHAYNYFNRFLQPATIIAEGINPGAMIEFAISNALVRFAVPMFAMFSGYLFFCKFTFSWKGYLEKVWKRVRTLVVPFVIWTALAGGFLYIVYQLVGLSRYSIVSEKVGVLLNQGILGWIELPPAFQLWYIVDLFKVVLISPLIYFLVKKCKLLPVLLLFVAWALEKYYLINTEILLFFTFGSYLAVNGIMVSGTDEVAKEKMPKYKRKTYAITILWLVGCIVYSVISATLGDVEKISYVLLALYKINVITGLISVWRLYDTSSREKWEGKWIKAAVSMTVMIYMAHEPFLHLMTDIILEVFAADIIRVLVYFCVTIGTICGCVFLGLFIKKVCPKVYYVMTGDRG